MFNIVLINPEIPQNTGNIARTCAVTSCSLNLIEPLGFSIEDKFLKRAGLDYWDKLDVNIYKSFEDFEEYYNNLKINNKNIYFFTTHATKSFFDSSLKYKKGDFLVFGKETAGIGQAIINKYSENCVRIPMGENIRSLNLSNSVAIAIYEGLRQNNFENML